MKELLQLEFFAEDSGIKVELISDNVSTLQLQLRVLDSKKHKILHKENEAIEFSYNMDTDSPETVAALMVSNI